MQVFIENEAQSNIKNIHDEKTLKYIKSFKVAREYPYPYGFILNSTGDDGDNLDVFILTNKRLKRGDIVSCIPIALMEQFELSWDEAKKESLEADHNILAVLEEEEELEISEKLKKELTDFVHHVFDNIRVNKTKVGCFLDKEAAIKHIENHKD